MDIVKANINILRRNKSIINNIMKNKYQNKEFEICNVNGYEIKGVDIFFKYNEFGIIDSFYYYDFETKEKEFKGKILFFDTHKYFVKISNVFEKHEKTNPIIYWIILDKKSNKEIKKKFSEMIDYYNFNIIVKMKESVLKKGLVTFHNEYVRDHVLIK